VTSNKCENRNVMMITVDELVANMKKSTAQLIDVRSPAEYWESHIDGAINLPLGTLDPASVGIDTDKEVILVCRTGRRAEMARQQLTAANIPARVLEGGMLAWLERSGTVIRGRKTVLPLEQQVQIAIGSLSLLGVGLGLNVNRKFLAINGLLGIGLIFAGLTGTCGLAVLISKAPWNRSKAQKSACFLSKTN
jgi:rhodanese-related sulfurtransferase